MQNNSNNTYNLLKFIHSNKLLNWSVKYLLDSNFSYNDKFNLTSIGSFLKRNKTQVAVQDNVNYKRVTIKINNGGIYLRDKKIGKSIGTKKQFEVKKGQFLLSKIDARNGAFGVVPKEVDTAIITGNFWTYDVDYLTINPHYLALITTTKQFISFCQRSSAGTTNRHYLQEQLFLNEKIPLPALPEQEKIVKAYQDKITQAEKLEQEATNLEKEINTFVLKELGVNLREVKKRKSGKLYFANFNELFNWVHGTDEAMFFEDLHEAKYPLVELGLAFDFISRPWKKKEESKEYIELGGIDPNFGVMKTKTVYAKKAPSRATQTVKTGDLIVGTTRPYLKKFAIIQDKNNGNVASSGFSTIQENQDKYNLHFLNEVLKSPIGIKQFEIKMTGALYPAITQADLLELKIPLPSIDIQNNIAESIQQMKNSQKDKFQQAQQLKKQALLDFENAIFKSAE